MFAYCALKYWSNRKRIETFRLNTDITHGVDAGQYVKEEKVDTFFHGSVTQKFADSKYMTSEKESALHHSSIGTY